jgi:hypothetical protein
MTVHDHGGGRTSWIDLWCWVVMCGLWEGNSVPSAFCWGSGFDCLIRIDPEHREVWVNVENASAFVGWLITPCETYLRYLV